MEEQKASMNLSPEGVLEIRLELKTTPDKILDTRIGALGMIEWAKEVALRYLTMQEMNAAKAKAASTIIRPNEVVQ